MTASVLENLYAVLQKRKTADADASYAASLYAGGSRKIAGKILEEAQEFIDEAFVLDEKPDDAHAQDNIRKEAADLLFHMLVMLSHHNVPVPDIFDILEQRFGTSGHDEKAGRGKRA